MSKKKCSKASYNTSGLRNHRDKPTESPEPTSIMPDREDLDPDWEPDTLHDSLKIDFEKEDESDNGESDTDTDEWDVGGKGGLIQMINMAIDNGDDPRDESWVPAQLRSKKKKNSKGRPKKYKKGPDVGSKSARTQHRYRAEITKQTTFDSYFTSKADQPKKTSAPVRVESVTPRRRSTMRNQPRSKRLMRVPRILSRDLLTERGDL
ncbi:hypothetical protein H0H87_012887 [Tephrocybe sp. NHM501043]|nr:hypothetical protein H0H87_011115 [Tephrocybe sp. NHM501043]KAG6823906.1 hypothetical protein H0H87_012887 [Tephrocybe sp. NHM501043]